MNKQKHVFMIRLVAASAAVLVGVLGGAAVPAQVSRLFSQDLTIHEETTTSGAPMGGGKATPGVSYFSGNAMLTTSTSGNDVLIRYDQQKMFIIDNKQKTYSETSFEELQKAMENMAAASGASEKQSKEAMEAMKQLMGGMAGGVSVTPLGPGEAVAGYNTEKYLMKMPPMNMEIWAAPDVTLPAVYYDAMKLQMPKNPMFDMTKMVEEFKKIKGLQMKSVMTMEMMGMKVTTTRLVTSVEKGPIPASRFELPAGYKAIPFPLGKRN